MEAGHGMQEKVWKEQGQGQKGRQVMRQRGYYLEGNTSGVKQRIEDEFYRLVYDMNRQYQDTKSSHGETELLGGASGSYRKKMSGSISRMEKEQDSIHKSFFKKLKELKSQADESGVSIPKIDDMIRKGVGR